MIRVAIRTCACFILASISGLCSAEYPLLGYDAEYPTRYKRTGVVADENGVLTATQVVASTFTGTFTGQDHTAGTGLSGSVYNGSVARTWTVDQTWLRAFMDADFATTGSLANYLPLTGGTMTGSVRVANGSILSPGLSFAGDASSGLAFVGTDMVVSYGGDKALGFAPGAIEIYPVSVQLWGDTAIAGDLNLSTGTVTAAQFVGGGSALTGLDAGDISAGTLAVARGGTGLASYAVGDLLYASGATTLGKLAGVATGNALISGGVTTAPAWGKVGLATHVSGTLPVANGGTGTGTAFTLGSMVFAGASGVYSQDNARLFWDDTNDRMVIGSSTALNSAVLTLRDTTGSSTWGPALLSMADASASLAAFTLDQTANDTYRINMASSSNMVLELDNSAGGITNFEMVDGLFRTDNGTQGSNGTSTGAGDLYIEDALEVDGSITALGTYSATVGATNRDLYIDNTGLVGYVTSARRINGRLNKTNERALAAQDETKLLRLTPKKYDKMDGTKDEIGLIAEEVAQVYPEIVSYHQDVTTRTLTRDDGSTLTETVLTQTDIPETVNYSRLVVPMLHMIQKQQAKIDDLEARLTALEKKQQR